MELDYLIQLGIQEKQFDAIYRKCAVHFALSDCTMWVLYYLSLYGDISQKKMTEIMMFPKQTINSSIANLNKDGYVSLTTGAEGDGRKTVTLTKKGKVLADSTVVKMMNAEVNAIKVLGKEKTAQFLSLYHDLFQAFSDSFNRTVF